MEGNAAIGAPFDNGPSSTDHPGAVFLYDGDSSDDGVYTQYTYGQLIHVFADPNPEAGDEFGAAIATVGDDLLIGAPGSSLTGPGDGVAYLFDANPTDPNFGDLLATLTLPDPDAAGQAHFGATVAAANTNAVIGAPGKDSGSGEVFVFGGDPTQLTFGSLLLDITNPDSQAGAQFGAALAGIGSDVIVGAPFDNTAASRRRHRLCLQRDDRGGAGGDTEPASHDVDRVRLGGRVGGAQRAHRLAAR